MADHPFADLALHGGRPARAAPIETRVSISEEARDHVLELLETGHLSSYYNGLWARRFEQAFAARHGPELAAVAVNSGTSALHLALTAAGIGPGDEVILPALCFVAAATSVVQNGAIPVICDAEPEHLTLDVGRVERLITPRTRAVLAVHFWGYPSDSPALRALCDRHGLVFIEDCAQALGGAIGGRPLGSFGDYATCAFSVRKHVSCGEGGMVLGSRPRQDRLRALSNYGKGPDWDDYESLGYSYRMAEFPAIVGLDGLARLDREVAARRYAAGLYRDRFAGSGLQPIPEPASGSGVFFKCPVLLPAGAEPIRRELIAAIGAENVSCRAPHRPLYRIPWLRDYFERSGRPQDARDCPVVESLYPRLIEIETGPHLPPPEAEVTAQAVLKVWRHFRPRIGGYAES